ncbi:uncharacterized protein PHALS_12932 [Plasmopara halstedii]|uniref:Uncharacterized protein n=1 Tax=Plasmopara halstedii TaxID=4781 RepID=A0A0P1AMV2_PLAHL|nr:uncharacterized protein PHALS_12932 [Plasmopara halstedii]CEG42677.1 hypothetical protein PHALS_12932 [Plasmopara halstedii]|eukprot:XP_024579046.1 hypothetical protein PHALS_12932 [Plasmopara halstedii]
MRATHSTSTTFSPPMANSSSKSVQCASPRKRKLSESTVNSPVSFNEAFGCSPTERVISPKKKVKPEEYAINGSNKWENYTAANIAYALDCLNADNNYNSFSGIEVEPIAFQETQDGDLTTDELQILQYFLA